MFAYVAGNNSFLKPLNAEEEKKYLLKYQEGSLEAKDVLIERNLRLVAHIVKKYANYSKEQEDLISVGTIGLIKAIITFNASKGTRLATYAARCIENEILMFLRAAKKYVNELYLQDPIGVDKEGNDITIEEKIADTRESIDDQVNLRLQIKALYEKMSVVLKDRERMVIKLRYGLEDGKEVTQREIADILGISRSYV
jgi:RNA polymerase sporulation-specific sigma factor